MASIVARTLWCYL